MRSTKVTRGSDALPLRVRRSSRTPRHPERPDPRRVARRILLQVIADIPDRAIVARVNGGLGVVLPAQGIGLRGFAFGENRLAKRQLAGRIIREPAGEALAGKVG